MSVSENLWEGKIQLVLSLVIAAFEFLLLEMLSFGNEGILGSRRGGSHRCVCHSLYYLSHPIGFFYLLVLGWRYEWLSAQLSKLCRERGHAACGHRETSDPFQRESKDLLFHLWSRTNRLEAALVFSNVVLQFSLALPLENQKLPGLTSHVGCQTLLCLQETCVFWPSFTILLLLHQHLVLQGCEQTPGLEGGDVKGAVPPLPIHTGKRLPRAVCPQSYSCRPLQQYWGTCKIVLLCEAPVPCPLLAAYRLERKQWGRSRVLLHLLAQLLVFS